MMDWDELADGTFADFVESLQRYGAIGEEIDELIDTTDLDGVIDTDALAHDRLSSLRRVPSV